jgi:hypothetical protein
MKNQFEDTRLRLAHTSWPENLCSHPPSFRGDLLIFARSLTTPATVHTGWRSNRHMPGHFAQYEGRHPGIRSAALFVSNERPRLAEVLYNERNVGSGAVLSPLRNVLKALVKRPDGFLEYLPLEYLRIMFVRPITGHQCMGVLVPIE